jgi:hypothetical protein
MGSRRSNAPFEFTLDVVVTDLDIPGIDRHDRRAGYEPLPPIPAARGARGRCRIAETMSA